MATSVSLNIPDNQCNNASLTSFDLSAYKLIERIEIGSENFFYSKVFILDGVYKLENLIIGYNSFSQKKYWYEKDESKSFHILNCESLESIQIGQYSFRYFAGEFELKNLPQLQSIQIGTLGSSSYNFCYSSFVIRGIDMILNIVMNRSSKSTIHYIGLCCIPKFLINNNRKY